MNDAKYVPLPNAPPDQQQQQPAAGDGARPAVGAAAAVPTRLQGLVRSINAGGGGGIAASMNAAAAAAAAAAAGGVLPEAKGQRSRSAGKMPGQRPLADGKAAVPRNNLLLPAQMPAQLRQRDKLVLLPRSASEQHEADTAMAAAWADRHAAAEAAGEAAAAVAASAAAAAAADLAAQQQPATSLFVDLTEVLPDSKGRVTVYCIAESLARGQLEAFVAAKLPGAVLTSHAEVLHMALPVAPSSEPADCFFFDYGVVCCWGLSAKQEQDILNNIAKKAQEQPLPPREIEVDKFEYNYSTASPPSMQNDTITISRHHANDPAVKLAICHALAQSTKLCIHEERVLELVLETKHLPQALAQNGTVNVSAEEVAQRIGQVFIQRAAVNLLGSVLDTPEFFWSAPDQLQTLYERACDYLELGRRVEVLNARFTVLQGMLDMLRDHITTTHSVRIEWIIIWLIAVELVVGCVELLGLFGAFKNIG